MMYPTAMATAPLNSNYQYVNMGYQQQYESHHPHPDEVAAARATITRNGNNNNKNSNSRSGGKNKSHKMKTRPQTRQRRDAYGEDDPKGWQYETGKQKKQSWHSLEARVGPSGEKGMAQLSVSRRHSSSSLGSSSSSSSRLNRVINKTNLDRHRVGMDIASNEEDFEMASDNEEEDTGHSEEQQQLITDNVRGRTRHNWKSTSPVPETAKNPITRTTRRMNGNIEDQEKSEDAEVEEDPNSLPKYSFLRGDNFNNRNPAVQYDSAIINNNNNGNADREGGGAEVGGMASASTTPTAMELECVAGYDGGLPQYFVLEAYDSRTRKLRLNITSAFPDLPLFRIDMEGMYLCLYLRRILFCDMGGSGGGWKK